MGDNVGRFDDVVSRWKSSVSTGLGCRRGQLGQVASVVYDEERVEVAQHFVAHRDAIQVLLEHLPQLAADIQQLQPPVPETQDLQLHLVVSLPEVLHSCVVHHKLQVELEETGVLGYPLAGAAPLLTPSLSLPWRGPP